jgi:hypothetical protein
MRTLDAQSRRALQALQNGRLAHLRLTEAARSGDPLAHALRSQADAQAAALVRAMVCPLPDMAASAAPVAAPSAALSFEPHAERASLVLSVGASELRYARVACLGLGRESVDPGAGPGSLDAMRAPLVTWSALSLPSSYRPYVHSMLEVRAALSTLMNEAEPVRVLVVTEPSVPAHVLARVLLSMPGGDAAKLALGSVSSATYAVELARSEDEAAAVRVRVRLGGYSLHVGKQFEDIPRIKTDSGFSFDHETLKQRLAQADARVTQVSFMSDVGSEDLLAALGSVAGVGSERVRLMIP